MKFSIITICYNSEGEIKRTLDSVLSQDYIGNVEYLIIDGASKDQTVLIAESYKEKFREKGYDYLISSEPDGGIYDAMNKGIDRATGDIIGIINSGDWYEPNALSTVSKAYEAYGFDMFYADINLIRNDGRIIVKHSKYDRFPTSRHWNHPSSFVRKELYNEIGMFRCKGIHDDFDFFLRVKKHNKKIIIQNVVLANFMTGGASNDKSLKKAIGRIKDRFSCYKDNGYSSVYIIECVLIEMVKALVS